MDLAESIVAFAESKVPDWTAFDEWTSTVTMAVTGGPQTITVSVEMDIVLLAQLDRLCKKEWKNDLKVVLNGGASLNPQHQGPIKAQFVVSGLDGLATYPNGNVRFFNPGTGVFTDHIFIECGTFSWDNIPKETKTRRAFKAMFIRMVRDGFLMPSQEFLQIITFPGGKMTVEGGPPSM